MILKLTAILHQGPRHSVPWQIPGKPEWVAQASGWEQKCLWSLKLILTFHVAFFLPIAQFSSVCLNVKFSPHLPINALEMCMFFPVALRTRKTFTPLEKHKTRKKRGPSIPCRRPSFWVPILDQPLLPWLALRTSSCRRGFSPQLHGRPYLMESALLGTQFYSQFYSLCSPPVTCSVALFWAPIFLCPDS